MCNGAVIAVFSNFGKVALDYSNFGKVALDYSSSKGLFYFHNEGKESKPGN